MRKTFCNLAFSAIFLAVSGRCIILFFEEKYLNITGWIVFGILIIWIISAFKNDKNIPGLGPYSYGDGSNQVGRCIYLNAMVVIFIVACIHG
ncbi:hypothetical protein [Glaciimonas sp. PCH181]|uniref:hypothetical protein n=1 Tax=Glaciimonas sp. PCH181 TaxID=2133943 RepID=UPI000D361D04|nr:hypothetical protein [Glaciimonas sp. PCH181]PUA18096.1 hypothetical protein C7W93_19925 [Glaciimonas sp. PCH181]